MTDTEHILAMRELARERTLRLESEPAERVEAWYAAEMDRLEREYITHHEDTP